MITIGGGGINMGGSFNMGATPVTAVPVPTDAQFNYVTALFYGNGANTAQNNTFVDSSTNNLTLTRNGTPTQGSFSPYGNNWSNYFNGSASYLNIASNAGFSFGTGDFTVESWIMQTGGSGNLPICQSDAVGSSSNDKWWFAITSTGLFFGTHNSGGFSVVTTTTFVLNTWYHVAVTRASGVMKMFINGVSTAFATTGTPSGYNLSQNGLAIGGMSTPSYWTGYISNLRIVKGTALYTATFTPSTTPLTAITNTSLLTCQSNRFVDNSSNALALTITGAPSVQRFNPLGNGQSPYTTSAIGGSVYFNGSGDKLTLPSSSVFDLSSNTWTIEWWMYSLATPSSGNQCRLIMAGSNGDAAGWDIGYDNNGSFGWYRPYGSPGTLIGAPSGTISLNNWYHIAVVCNAGSARIYVNGVSVAGPTTITLPSSAAQTLRIGYDDVGTVNFQYNGYLSDLRIVKGTAVYTSNFTPPTTPLTTVTNTQLLLNFANASIFDSSGINNVVTAGSAQASTTQVKYGTASMKFNGSSDYLTMLASPNLSFNTGDFTIEGWMNLSSATGAYRTIVSIPHSSGKLIVRFGNSAAYNSYFQVSTLTTTAANVYSTNQTQTALLNQWVHFAFTRSSSTCRVFLNGVLQNIGTGAPATSFVSNTFSDSTNITNNATVGIGEDVGTDTSFIGYLDELRITKGYARYTSAFTPPTESLPGG